MGIVFVLSSSMRRSDMAFCHGWNVTPPQPPPTPVLIEFLYVAAD